MCRVIGAPAEAEQEIKMDLPGGLGPFAQSVSRDRIKENITLCVLCASVVKSKGFIIRYP